jgi:6-phosphogluconolactonase
MEFFAYFGSSTKSGIHAARYFSDTGKMVEMGRVAEIENPSFLAMHPSNRYLYAVSEIEKFEDQVSGAVAAYKIDAKSGSLTLINTRQSGGPGPCYIALDPRARMISVANYNDGSVTTFQLQADDGGIGARAAFFKNNGSSVDPVRQASAHAHGCFFSSDGKLLVTTDLGLDKIFSYAVNTDASLTQEKYRWVNALAGSGPRHFAYHPNGREGYAINELTSTVTRYGINRDETRLTMHETTPTLDENFQGTNTAAEIVIDKAGRYLYCSNRGADEIVVFRIGAEGGLKFVQRIATGGKAPRHFTLDRDGSHIIVGNQDSNSVTVFARDAASGKMSGPVVKIDVPTPTCTVLACIACLA